MEIVYSYKVTKHYVHRFDELSYNIKRRLVESLMNYIVDNKILFEEKYQEAYKEWGSQSIVEPDGIYTNPKQVFLWKHYKGALLSELKKGKYTKSGENINDISIIFNRDLHKDIRNFLPDVLRDYVNSKSSYHEKIKDIVNGIIGHIKARSK